jgi:uncharacterized protein (TIGR01777 family)
VKIVIPGGSGQIGTVLARAWQRSGDEVVVISRRPARRPWRVVAWDGASLGDWWRELDGCDTVINLAGRSVNCRYTPANRRVILESRVTSTRLVGQAIARCGRPPRVWLQASTATIYAHRYDQANTESSGLIGESSTHADWAFSIDVARAWERALEDADVPATRKVALRAAVVMSPDAGGVFDTLLRLVRSGLGGTAGDGRQFVSWVHDADLIEAVRWLVARDLSGVVNIAAPGALPNREFMRALREAAGVPIGLPAGGWMLRVGAAVMRTETELLLKSRRVFPERLVQDGFVFQYPTWPEAAVDLHRRWRSSSESDGSMRG